MIYIFLQCQEALLVWIDLTSKKGLQRGKRKGHLNQGTEQNVPLQVLQTLPNASHNILLEATYL